MQCFLLQHSTTLLQVHARIKLQQHQQHTPHNVNPSWLTCTDQLCRSVPKIQHFASESPLRTKALPFSHVVVAVVTASVPPKSANISVFLPVSALLLSLYLITNFIVPEMITKYFRFNNADEDQNVDDINAREDK